MQARTTQIPSCVEYSHLVFFAVGWDTDSSYCYIPECCLWKSFALCRIHHTYTLSLQNFFEQGYDQVFSGSLRNCYFFDCVTSVQLARDQNLPWSEFLSTTKSSRGPVYFLKFALYNHNSTSMYQSCTNCTRKEVMYLYGKNEVLASIFNDKIQQNPCGKSLQSNIQVSR